MAGRRAQSPPDGIRLRPARAPDLGEEALARIMQAVIEAGLDAVREKQEAPDARP